MPFQSISSITLFYVPFFCDGISRVPPHTRPIFVMQTHVYMLYCQGCFGLTIPTHGKHHQRKCHQHRTLNKNHFYGYAYMAIKGDKDFHLWCAAGASKATIALSMQAICISQTDTYCLVMLIYMGSLNFHGLIWILIVCVLRI